MQYTTLGKTGLKVSVAGLGCGGNSRIGLGAGLSEARSIALVQAALDLGVNLIDTAQVYGTEGIVGKAIKGRPRDAVVISTKSHISDFDASNPLPPAAVVANLDASLKALDTDHVDIFHLHAVWPHLYDHAMNAILPALLREKEKGKLRHLAISETAPRDPAHVMLERAVEDPVWEVFMLAFHMMNQNARNRLLARTQANRVGTLCMFAVRNIFSQPGVLDDTIAQLAAEGQLPPEVAATKDPLGFLIHEAGAENLIDAAYRFARHEPGIDVVLFGTSSIEHLKANVASILRPPLPAADVAGLYALFGHLTGVGLDLPERTRQRLARGAYQTPT
ncbi:MAG TPA: aldo/keto reductase [Hyphomicrobiaceae bacterium]|nr:aldo/keto reductase [Hyphomicrobiaceae bacterium]